MRDDRAASDAPPPAGASGPSAADARAQSEDPSGNLGEERGEDGGLAIDDLEEVQETALASVNELLRGFVEHIPYVIGGFVVLLLTWGLTRLVEAIGTRVLSRWNKRESVKELILRLVSILLWVLGLLLAAIVLFPGLTPSRALGGLGLVSIAVGLAFKDIFENFFAGILILWRFPFERGDFIECEGLVGKVERVLVRMTYIRQTTGELVVVPNAFLFKNPVTVLTSLPNRRVTIMAGVRLRCERARGGRGHHRRGERLPDRQRGRPRADLRPGLRLESSIDIEVTWWTGATPVEVRRSRAEVVIAVKGALDAAGIEIPFPYRTLTFKEPLPVNRIEENRS